MRYSLVSVLLSKTFLKTLSRQLYLKLTKFTRRSNGPKAFFSRLALAADFLKHMARYNWEVIRRSKRCLRNLAADNVQEVFVYGESDVKEVLYDLTFEIPMKIKTIGEDYKFHRNFGRAELPIEMYAASREKVIVASLVNIDERIKRLRAWGVKDERLVLLR
jgi:hypothetical protein